MKSHISITQLVRDLLTDKPDTRDDDDLLYWWVCKRINPDTLKKSFEEVVINREKYFLPTYASVMTARAKVTKESPELDNIVHKNKRRKKRQQEQWENNPYQE